MDTVEKLFVRTLDDLESRLTQDDPYEILMIAGLLRKLLLDEFPLIDQVNRNQRLKLSFDVGASIPLRSAAPFVPGFLAVYDAFDPQHAPPHVRAGMLSRDQFLASVIVAADGHRYSVRDVIAFEANIMGAIHAGSADTEKEKVLRRTEEIFGLVATPPRWDNSKRSDELFQERLSHCETPSNRRERPPDPALNRTRRHMAPTWRASAWRAG